MTAEVIRELFLPLEDLRDGINPIRVLHAAVTLAGIADMGPALPRASNLPREHEGAVGEAARSLLAEDREVARGVRCSA